MTQEEYYLDKIARIGELIEGSSRIVLGIGSGLSAAGGLNYCDEVLSKKWYPEYYSLGLKTIQQIQGTFWWFDEDAKTRYWGFWAQHIFHIRYESHATQPYLDLAEIARDKETFVYTTNCDSQIEKAGFDSENIFAMQGNYCYFQCSKPCSNDLYYNEDMVKNMISHMPSPFEVREEDIPYCPRCGKPLVPNLRCDNSFVEKPHLKNAQKFQDFVRDDKQELLLLELGVGYNTPVIIRYPFERLAQFRPYTHLARVNLSEASVPEGIAHSSVTLDADLGKVMPDLKFALK